MRLLLACFLIFLTNNLFAQQNGGVVMSRDTINISGYIYNSEETPHAGVIIYSRQKDTTYNLTNLQTVTDIKGYFKINGAFFNDTLIVGGFRVYNKGSRYLVIYSPSETRKFDAPVEVTAHRTHPKPLAKFIIKQYKEENTNKVYGESEIDPIYPGGPIRFQNEIKKKLIYPQKAIDNNIEGTVEIGFRILKDGKVDNYKVLKGLGYGCDEQLIQAMKSMIRWKPGIENGRPVEFNYTMDVEFKLTDK